MAKATLTGFDEYEKLLQKLGDNSEAIVKSGIYSGANVIANAVKAQINDLRSDGPSEYEKERRQKQIAGLRESMGISSMRNDKGFLNVKVGFDGYNDLGQANIMVARIFESGTSFSSKQPFVKKAIRASRAKAEETMKATIDEKIYAITKEVN